MKNTQISDRTRLVYERIYNRNKNLLMWVVNNNSTCGIDSAELESIGMGALLRTIEYYGKARREETRLRIKKRPAKISTVFVNNFKNAIRTELYKRGIVEDPYYRKVTTRKRGSIGKKRIPQGQVISMETPLDDESETTVELTIKDPSSLMSEKKRELFDVLRRRVTDRISRKILLYLYLGVPREGRNNIQKVLNLSKADVDNRLKRVWSMLKEEGYNLKERKYDVEEKVFEESLKFDQLIAV